MADYIEVDGLRVDVNMVRNWRGRLDQLDYERQQLAHERDSLQAQLDAYKADAADLYQAAGVFNMPERVMDNLSDMANGKETRHYILPVFPDENPLETQLEATRALCEEVFNDAWHMGYIAGLCDGHPLNSPSGDVDEDLKEYNLHARLRQQAKESG